MRPTVLVVEDETAIRELVVTALEREGFEVLSAGAGQEALELAAAFEGQIRLLVTDLVMPGMSGTELAQQMLRARPGLKVVYVSGYTERPDRLLASRARQRPSDSLFIPKPFSPAQLAVELHELLAAGPEPASRPGS